MALPARSGNGNHRVIPVMNGLSETYLGKIASCNRALNLVGVTRQSLLQKYDGVRFRDSSLSKRAVFECLLEGNLEAATLDYFTAKCAPLIHFRDSRKPHEYAVDLVLGWLIEDGLLAVLKARGLRVKLDGRDRHREILGEFQISAQPDLRVETATGSRVVEIFADWKGTWRRKNHADLRDKKFGKLVSERAVMLGVSPITAEGFVIDFGRSNHGFRENFIAAYDKRGYTKTGVCEDLVPLDRAVSNLVALLGEQSAGNRAGSWFFAKLSEAVKKFLVRAKKLRDGGATR